MEETESTKEAVKVIERMVNTIDSFFVENIGRNLVRIHPTLQQNFHRLVVAWVQAQSENKWSDPRNDATVKQCRKMWDVIREDIYLPHI